MSNFLEVILAQLKRASGRVVLREIHGDRFVSVTGRELLDQVQLLRLFLRNFGFQPGDRCALLAPNAIRWAASHLALMAEGVIVVPLYFRQAPAELAGMMKDCQPRLIFVSDAALGESVAHAWPEAPRRVLFEEALRESASQSRLPDEPNPRTDSDIVTIIYTSGTSGEPKGVCLNVGNLTHMLSCTTERLNQLMGATREPDRVFHYLPFNFGASTILLLSCLTRESVLALSTDLNKLADEIRLASPNYFLNVPTLLERVRRGVEEAIAKRPAIIRSLFSKARAAWQRKHVGRGSALDAFWLALGRVLIFRKIRERFGPHIRALICGSAPLAPETQQFFLMLGIPVLQAYGLTETTGICTLDDPRVPVEPGYVGPAITGIEMKVAENEEIVVRGPHIFPGYWNRPEETARVLQDGWFHTGDQGEVNVRGNWRISGRIKNLIILNSGHNIAPEPLEEKVARLLPTAQQVVVIGNGRGYLCALVTGAVEPAAVQSALDAVNPELPHYRQIRNFTMIREAFTPESGLLTAMGKIRRDAINARYASEINAMYDSKGAGEASSRQHA
ncbi:MAG TPA: AMP-binding protein [Candidatus Polarisedimenticolia bacterium]|nr:AMP-binding protein [Candidatus Polarisedimenticolia bacterium]